MADLFSLKNRVALVTGASRGLGRDMASPWPSRRHRAVRRPHRERARGHGQGHQAQEGGKAEVVPLDVTDEDSVRDAVRAIIRKHRRIDVLVNNAGIIHRDAHRRHRDARISAR